MYRLAVLNSHPIQYFAPLYRRIAQEPAVDLTVYYCSHQGVEEYIDQGFGQRFKWDIPLLEGFSYKFLPNLRRQDHIKGIYSLINPMIMKELYQERYDALWIHGHNHLTYLMAIAAAKILGTSILMRCETHLLLQRSTFKRMLRRPLMRVFYQLCDAFLPIGTLNADFYRFHNVPEEKLFFTPYTVDNMFFANGTKLSEEQRTAVRSEIGLDLSDPVILFSSKLTPRKRPMDLLKAYHEVRKQNISASLLFVGSGNEEPNLKKYIQENNIPDVHFAGFRNQSELSKFYAICDIFVLPSHREPWGLVVNEVMNAGKPVIVSDQVGAGKDLVIDGENGFVVPVGDIGTLASRLKHLAEEPVLRLCMGQKSQERIAEWDFETDCRGVLNALEYVTQHRKCGRISDHSRSTGEK